MESQNCKSHFNFKRDSPNVFGKGRGPVSFGSHSDTLETLSNSSPPSPTLQNSSTLNDESLLNDSSIQLTHSYRGKVKAQDVYGGPLMFGGSSSARRNRISAQSPYTRTASHRHSWLNKMSTHNTTKAPVTPVSQPQRPKTEENMSLSAKSILDALKNISALQEGVQGFVPREESRPASVVPLSVLLASSQDISHSPNLKRRRPDLSSSAISRNTPNMRALLRGPPVRKLMSPVAAPIRSRRTANNINHLMASSSSVVPETTQTKSPGQSTGIFSIASSSKAVVSIPPLATNPISGTNGVTEEGRIRLNFPIPAFMKQSEYPGDHKTELSKKSGKVRARIGKVSKEMDVLPSPVSPHLTNPPILPLKDIPSFELGFFKSLSASTKSMTPEKTASGNKPDLPTLAPENNPLKDDPISTSNLFSSTHVTTLIPPVKRTTSNFTFSMPVVVSESLNTKVPGVNGQMGSTPQFTFTSPQIISSLPSLNTEIPPQTPEMTFTQMPDLTSGPAFSANHRCNDYFQATPSLKKGSVVDFLGGSNKLPDVTGVANFNEPLKYWGSNNWTRNEVMD